MEPILCLKAIIDDFFEKSELSCRLVDIAPVFPHGRFYLRYNARLFFTTEVHPAVGFSPVSVDSPSFLIKMLKSDRRTPVNDEAEIKRCIYVICLQSRLTEADKFTNATPRL